MEGLMDRARSGGRGLLGTWAKIPSLETIEMLAHAGFDFVVIDMEHAPLALDRVYEMIFASQRMGMYALVRLPDHLGSPIQPALDAGADGLLVPRITSTEVADAITRRMVFSPKGERGLGATSRAGRWALMPLQDYLKRGDEQCLRMVQLEDWATLEAAGQFARLPHVNGLFVGLGDLFLSSGKAASTPEVQALVRTVLKVTQDAGILSGIAAGSPAEARQYLRLGYRLVMVSNDATLFGSAAAEAVRATLQPEGNSQAV
jgi:2-dehydro-3-deoxyglucarate aldolase/4-hydroxy-2-oxoheptanedioate aldolase